MNTGVYFSVACSSGLGKVYTGNGKGARSMIWEVAWWYSKCATITWPRKSKDGTSFCYASNWQAICSEISWSVLGTLIQLGVFLHQKYFLGLGWWSIQNHKWHWEGINGYKLALFLCNMHTNYHGLEDEMYPLEGFTKARWKICSEIVW